MYFLFIVFFFFFFRNPLKRVGGSKQSPDQGQRSPTISWWTPLSISALGGEPHSDPQDRVLWTRRRASFDSCWSNVCVCVRACVWQRGWVAVNIIRSPTPEQKAVSEPAVIMDHKHDATLHICGEQLQNVSNSVINIPLFTVLFGFAKI